MSSSFHKIEQQLTARIVKDSIKTFSKKKLLEKQDENCMLVEYYYVYVYNVCVCMYVIKTLEKYF